MTRDGQCQILMWKIPRYVVVPSSSSKYYYYDFCCYTAAITTANSNNNTTIQYNFLAMCTVRQLMQTTPIAHSHWYMRGLSYRRNRFFMKLFRTSYINVVTGYMIRILLRVYRETASGPRPRICKSRAVRYRSGTILKTCYYYHHRRRRPLRHHHQHTSSRSRWPKK